MKNNSIGIEALPTKIFDDSFVKYLINKIERELLNEIRNGEVYKIVLDEVRKDINKKVLGVLKEISNENNLYPYGSNTKNIIHEVINKEIKGGNKNK